MVITGLTRNQFDGNVTWVRIPPAPPTQKAPPRGQCHLDNDIGQKAKGTDYHRMVVSLLACRENYQQTGIRNRQMFPSASKKCTIQLLGYSVEEAYCRLEFDFARV